MISNTDNRPLLMGILNVTPDSFSDGGKFIDKDIASNHVRKMVEEGADIIDIGGESTRPGSMRVDADEQLKRILPVIKAVKKEIPDHILISVDTTLSRVADAALAAGADIINDVSAGRDDKEMLQVVSSSQCYYIIMHMQGTPQTMQEDPVYDDVVEEVKSFLLEHAESAINSGISQQKIIIDPGIGFGKTREHNITLMSNLNILVNTGYPVLLGTSRKRFMGSICASTPDQLVGATCATTALGVAAGVRIFRVHDIRENRQAADVAWTILKKDD